MMALRKKRVSFVQSRCVPVPYHSRNQGSRCIPYLSYSIGAYLSYSRGAYLSYSQVSAYLSRSKGPSLSMRNEDIKEVRIFDAIDDRSANLYSSNNHANYMVIGEVKTMQTDIKKVYNIMNSNRMKVK
jgi:hypothetical protein